MILTLRSDQNSKKQTTQSKTTEETNEADDGRGVIYIGHLPFGFFEQQLKGFFTQFGTVTRVRVSRNPKTGRSRHYGFVEFLERDVAVIAADTMDGYVT
jgi:nucleolar protein 15